MAKKKGGAAAKKGKKKEEVVKISEKDLHLMKIQALQDTLQEETDRHDLLQEQLATWKERYEREVDSKEACVEHLKRVLSEETEKGVALQKKLSDASDAKNLNEERVRQQLSNIGRRKEEIKSLFLQQKLELEGKLSVLEEMRLQRNSLRANMERVEAALIAKRDAEREQSRDVDEARVRRLRVSRDEFRKRAAAARRQWEDAFELRLAVHAQAVLRENAALRWRCRGATEHLLRAQDRHRHLVHRDGTLRFEREVDAGIEKRLKADSVACEEQIEKLKHQFDPDADTDALIDGAESRLEGRRSRCQVIRTALCRKRENVGDVEKLLQDQRDYLRFLHGQIQKYVNRNGVLTSVALRAGDVLKGKKQSAEVGAFRVDVDADILMQLKMILDVGPMEDDEQSA